MSRVTRWISNLTLIVLVTGLTACALFEERKGPPVYFGPRDQVFYASFDEVWRNVNRVLQAYPLRISNMDQGVLETDLIKDDHIWSPPHKPDSFAAGESYKLTVKVIKGALSNQSATKVTIVKERMIQPDFFSEPKTLPSDGLEEKALLYRIGREIQIERALAKAQKKK